jgi:hypothetical protein
MLTIQRTIDIPASRRIYLDLPENVPSGRTSVVLTFDAPEKTEQPKAQHDLAPFPTLEELKEEAAAKTAKRLLEGRKAFEELGTQKISRPFLNGIDGLEYQRSIRDEWRN